jgi:hypothetical protein
MPGNQWRAAIKETQLMLAVSPPIAKLFTRTRPLPRVRKQRNEIEPFDHVVKRLQEEMALIDKQ